MPKNSRKSPKKTSDIYPILQPPQDPNEGAEQERAEQRHPPEGAAQPPQDPNIATQEGAEGGAQKPAAPEQATEIQALVKQFKEQLESLEKICDAFVHDQSLESQGFEMLDKFKEKWDLLCNEDVKKYGGTKLIIKDYEELYQSIKDGIGIRRRELMLVPPKEVVQALKVGPAEILNDLLTDKIEILEAGSKILEKESEELHTELNKTLLGNRSLMEEIKKLRGNEEARKKLLTDCEKEIKGLKKKLSEAEQSITKLNLRKEEQKKQNDKKSKSIIEKDMTIKALEKKLREAMEQKEAAEKEHEKTRNEKEALQEAFDKLSKNSQFNKEVSKALSDSKQSLNRSNKTAENLMKFNGRLLNDIKTLKALNQSLTASNQSLTALNQSLTASNQNLKEECFGMRTILTDKINKMNERIETLKKLLDANGVEFDKDEFSVTEETFNHELECRKFRCKNKLNYIRGVMGDLNNNFVLEGGHYLDVLDQALKAKDGWKKYKKAAALKEAVETYYRMCDSHCDSLADFYGFISKAEESLKQKEWPTQSEDENFYKEIDRFKDYSILFTKESQKLREISWYAEIDISKIVGKKSDKVKHDSDRTDETKEAPPNTDLACAASVANPANIAVLSLDPNIQNDKEGKIELI
ncbi:hypothetical protein RLOatenuis_8010 [Rickettsiales bacterium]|nr:hypothetical protein RLOatenuis_8010 [Rickettsiales bacterium]